MTGVEKLADEELTNIQTVSQEDMNQSRHEVKLDRRSLPLVPQPSEDPMDPLN